MLEGKKDIFRDKQKKNAKGVEKKMKKSRGSDSPLSRKERGGKRSI